MISKYITVIKVTILLTLIYITHWSYSMTEIEYSRIIRSYDVSKARLFHDNKGFYILTNNSLSKIKDFWVDWRLRNVTEQELNLYLQNNYIKIIQLNNGEITLSRYKI